MSSHEITHTTNYTWHGLVKYGEVHRVIFTTPDREQEPLPFMVVHRGGIDPLWFDYTYIGNHNPQGIPSGDLEALKPDCFVVMPGQSFRFTPTHRLDQVTLTSTGDVHYSVMLLW